MENSSISVAVRVRPFSDKEQALLSTTYNAGPTLFSSDPNSSSSSVQSYTTPQPPRLASSSGALRKVLKVLDERILVFDPPETNAVASFQKQAMPVMGKKVKDIRFCFDRVFDEQCGQEEVYDGSAKELVGHVMNGFNSTVFAYGATGCGKTHTISGSREQPGIVFLIMKDLFDRIALRSGDTDFSLTVSYLEIYNENIRDLLAPESGFLDLREHNGKATPAGLSTKEPTKASDVVEWITYGNQNRTVNATQANAVSSRSHAVLTVTVSQRARGGGMTDSHSTASLSIIDLAGSERASVTKNKGERLLEGANINRSLLALGNCINALCDPRRRGHVPYRDSKLTRLLKQSLGGNCKTVMIVCVSPASSHYDETHNTLQYANRAKEIKTKAVRNVISVDRHVAQYCQQILEQSQQIEHLRKQLAEQQSTSSVGEREEDAKQAIRSKDRLLSSWEQAKERMVRSERARVEKTAVMGILEVLDQWKGTAFTSLEWESTADSVAAASTVAAIRAGSESLVQSLTQASARYSTDIAQGENAFDSYAAFLNGITTTLRAQRPGAIPLFTAETRILTGKLDLALAEAREAGMAEGMKVQARAMNAMCEARIKVSTAKDVARDAGELVGEQVLRRLADGIDAANRAAFSFLTDSQPLAAGQKRDQGSRSPFEPQSPWMKASRVAVTGPGSAPSGSLASPVRPTTAKTFVRQSPRKAVSMQARRDPSPKKRKEVQWRDEAGGDEGLEDVKFASPDSSVAGTPVASTSTNPWAGVQSLRSQASSPSLNGTSPGTAAQQMSANLKARSSVMRPLRAPGVARASPLAPLAENKPFSFLREDAAMPPPPIPPSSSRAAFGDVANTSASSDTSSRESFSMAGPSGLYAPLVSKPAEPDTPGRKAARVRRVSTTGPQRSLKPNRRVSYIPPTPLAKPNRIGFGSAFAPPSSARKSPRKVALPARRPSLAIGGNTGRPSLALGGGNPGATVPSLNIPGSKSAARIAARRESVALAMAAGGGSAAAAARKGSPAGAAPKAGPWR